MSAILLFPMVSALATPFAQVEMPEPLPSHKTLSLMVFFLGGVVCSILLLVGILAVLVRRAHRPAAGPARPFDDRASFARRAPAASGERLRCPECGSEVDGNLPGALCPRCLLKCGLHPVESVPPAPGNPSTVAYVAAGPAPTPAELAGRFPQLEILELLGRGGMGAVYKARQTKLDRLVALKVVTPEAARDPAFAERFAREARAMARLNHPNIVGVHDYGEVDGLYYFVMEYVDGVNLRQMLQAGQVQPQEAMRVVPQLCAALQYAHDEGVVHRDIKPENILVDRRGNVKIADFGLAKLVGRSTVGQKLTGSQQVMGTPHYMAPEQIDRPLAVDHRADIYALGVVFYEMLTGELPLGRFPPPSQKAPVDARLDEVVLRTLDRDPTRRYQHVSDIGSAVEAIFRAPIEKTVAGVVQALSPADVIGLIGLAVCLAVIGLAGAATQNALVLLGVSAVGVIAAMFRWGSLAKPLAGWVLAAGGIGVVMLTLYSTPGLWGLAIMIGGSLLPPLVHLFGTGEAKRGGQTDLDGEELPIKSLSPTEADIFRVLKRFEGDASLNLAPDLPAEGLHNARRTCGVPPAERVLGLIDLAGDEEMNSCVLFGGTGVFFSSKQKTGDVKGAILYAQINERLFVNHGKAVYLGKEQYIYLDPDECPVDGETLANLLNAVRDAVLARM
jgi:tRNA A-37 threonylcarbamoyl transferase component Bud32